MENADKLPSENEGLERAVRAAINEITNKAEYLRGISRLDPSIKSLLDIVFGTDETSKRQAEILADMVVVSGHEGDLSDITYLVYFLEDFLSNDFLALKQNIATGLYSLENISVRIRPVEISALLNAVRTNDEIFLKLGCNPV